MTRRESDLIHRGVCYLLLTPIPLASEKTIGEESQFASMNKLGGVMISYLKSPRSKNRNVKERISRHRKGSKSKKT